MQMLCCGAVLLQEFSDWAQCQVLELVAHYTPASDAEVRQQQQQHLYT
jgi:myo-inositol catabolism protein IolC